ncbi:MAG TPA: hypothetical protein VKB57_22300 [Acidimicrobiales bacterium]|nr:hypothetical protein [Acidimicrobiales bacterium]
MTDSDDGTVDMTELDAELDRLLAGEAPSAQAPAWCGDVAVLVRTALAPAREDELAREAEIVAQMRELRLAVLAEAEAAVDAAAEAEAEATPEPEAEAEVAPEPEAEADEAEAGEATGRPGAYRDAGPAVIDLRAPRAPVDLDAYRAKHGGERYYRAKHAAARLENSKYPLARTVGRVVAMKAVAVTTAVGIAAAAAAATTGIVATVVVPALTQPEHHVSTTTPAPATEGPEVGTTATRHGHSRSGAAATDRSECASVLPACVPLPAALVPTVSKDVADAAAAMTASAGTTPTTTSTADTTATTVSEAPPTSVAEPPPTTETPTTVSEPPPTTEPPTTAPPDTEPAGATSFSAGDAP